MSNSKKKTTWPRDLSNVWPWFRNLVVTASVLLVLLAGYESYELFAGIVSEEDIENPITFLIALVGLLLTVVWIIVFLLCVVYTSRITYRMMKNLHVLEAPVEMKPAWAVGWHFVPVANLLMPMRGVREIWRGTFALSSQPEPNPDVIGAWWGCWVLGNIAGTVSFRMSSQAGGTSEFGPTDIGLYTASLYIGVASSLLLALACWFMLKVFGPMVRAQNEIVREAPTPTPA